jgi:hypothetical protein
VDDLQAVRVLDAGYDLLEETPGFRFRHTTMGNDIVEEFATGVFKNEDDICRCRNYFVTASI